MASFLLGEQAIVSDRALRQFQLRLFKLFFGGPRQTTLLGFIAHQTLVDLRQRRRGVRQVVDLLVERLNLHAERGPLLFEHVDAHLS